MWTRRGLVSAVFCFAGLYAYGQQADLMNAADPLPGITTSGQPDQAALEALANKGYVAVIDLRTPEESRGLDEQRVVEQLGMKYVSLPIAGGVDITYENAAALDAILAKAEGPVLLHCASGNRAGALLALREKLAGHSSEDALTLGEAAGLTSLRAVVEARLAEQ